MNKFKHDILLRIVKSINIVLITIPFAVCWFFYYADHVVSPFYSKGNWLVILLFLVFYITFGRIYDAFLISIYSVAEIMYSQILSAMLSDGVMYVIICLLSKGFPNLLPRLFGNCRAASSFSVMGTRSKTMVLSDVRTTAYGNHL